MTVGLENKPVLDLEQLGMMRSLDDGRGVFLSELIEIFSEEVPTLIVRLEEALQNDSETMSKRLAHKIKGMGANLGTARLVLLLLDIELNYETFEKAYKNSLAGLIQAEYSLALEHLRHNWRVAAA